MVITIDGPAGSGKSTVARRVAERLGFRYLDTGAMYRGLTAVALDRGVALEDGDALAALAGVAPPPGTDLRGARVSRHVSTVSGHPAVRARMRVLQREARGDLVLEGRDTGSVVRPDAEVKIYLVAPAEVRARRRAVELGAPEREVGAALAERDRRDAPQLAPAPDAVVIDTGGLSVDEVVERVLELAEAAGRA